MHKKGAIDRTIESTTHNSFTLRTNWPGQVEGISKTPKRLILELRRMCANWGLERQAMTNKHWKRAVQHPYQRDVATSSFIGKARHSPSNQLQGGMGKEIVAMYAPKDCTVHCTLSPSKRNESHTRSVVCWRETKIKNIYVHQQVYNLTPLLGATAVRSKHSLRPLSQETSSSEDHHCETLFALPTKLRN